MYKELEKHKEESGSVEVPAYDCNQNQGAKGIFWSWCRGQIAKHRRYAQGHDGTGLTDEKIEKLRRIGLEMGPSYDEMYDRLVAYKSERGTLDVEKEAVGGGEDEDNGLLRAWAKEQRKFLARHFLGEAVPLSHERVQRLVSLGFVQRESHSGKGKYYDVVDADSKNKKGFGGEHWCEFVLVVFGFSSQKIWFADFVFPWLALRGDV